MSLLNQIFGLYKENPTEKEYHFSEAEETELKNGLAGLVNVARKNGSNSEETKKYFRETLAGYHPEGLRYYFKQLGAVLLLLNDRVNEDKRYRKNY